MKLANEHYEFDFIGYGRWYIVALLPDGRAYGIGNALAPQTATLEELLAAPVQLFERLWELAPRSVVVGGFDK